MGSVAFQRKVTKTALIDNKVISSVIFSKNKFSIMIKHKANAYFIVATKATERSVGACKLGVNRPKGTPHIAKENDSFLIV
jgi:hypothetical protein